MFVSESPGLLKRFCKIPWRFQMTFVAPSKQLPTFAATIISACGAIQNASLIIDQIVFEPRHLNALLVRHSLPPLCSRDWSLTVTGCEEAESLLIAALSGGIDFAFIPTPKPFVIYADHDEYVTFSTPIQNPISIA